MQEFNESFEEDEEPIDVEQILRDLEQSEIDSKERDARWKKMEEDGIQGIIKYFDRIHDSLSNYNNLLIGAFFALGQIKKDIPSLTILIPVFNLILLLYINYRLMEKYRFESSITTQPFDLFDKHMKRGDVTNLWSLVAIASTLLVTGSFIYYLAFY